MPYSAGIDPPPAYLKGVTKYLLLLTAICEALLTKEICALRPPSEIAQRLITLIENHPNPSLRQDFQRLLAVLNHPVGSLLLTHSWKPLPALSVEERERRLLWMANHSVGFKRQAFQGLKRLIMWVAYGNSPGGKPNPLWQAMGYEGAPPLDSSFQPPERYWSHLPDSPHPLEADYIVIGSGAGGGVVAARLTEAGHTVLVLEMGGDDGQTRPGMNELEGLQSLYLGNGIVVTRDSSIMILAGSALGGGTTINWTTSLRAPENVFEEWVRDFALDGWDCQTMQQQYGRVERDLHVQCHPDEHNAPNSVLIRGCEALGMSVKSTNRNVKDCQGQCDFCAFGCRFRSKQSTAESYLKRAAETGRLQLIIHAKAQRVEILNGRAVGVVGVAHLNGQPVSFRANAAKGVVVAAGAVETPALLLRSGVSHPQVGKNLRLHPTVAVAGHYDSDIHPWKGAPQSAVSGALLNLDGRGYGVLLETPALYPGIAASAMPFLNAKDHAEQMRRLPNGAVLLAIARDCRSGQVTVGKLGEPIIDYRLDKPTGNHLMKGMDALTKIHFSAGATEVSTLHQPPLRFYRETDWKSTKGGQSKAAQTRHSRERWNPQRTTAYDEHTFYESCLKAGFAPNRITMFSAHQMGTCRASGNRHQGVVNPRGQCWEVPNLIVTDASLFPTALGVNPMLTIMACAHTVCDHLLNP
ncbi:MAG: GMC family oxidoreductase [Fimbriimonadia bacterium]|nr:GMC family oxidoreductase [Fimbriimonadia bacterium]